MLYRDWYTCIIVIDSVFSPYCFFILIIWVKWFSDEVIFHFVPSTLFEYEKIPRIEFFIPKLDTSKIIMSDFSLIVECLHKSHKYGDHFLRDFSFFFYRFFNFFLTNGHMLRVHRITSISFFIDIFIFWGAKTPFSDCPV